LKERAIAPQRNAQILRRRLFRLVYLSLELGALVTARYGLAEGPQAFRDLVERRGLKIVVEPAR